MNGYNFTERVRKILVLAREGAAGRHHGYVGPEHLLIALLLEGEGVAAAVLQNLGADLEELTARVEGHLEPGNASQPIGPDLPYTSRAKKVLELAMSEARHLHHSYVGSEHLLIGLLREEKGIAAQVLNEAEMSTAIVRAETLRLLGAEPEPAYQPSSGRRFAAIAIEIRHEDGSSVREEFRSVVAAMHFLRRAARPDPI